jgi:hypothetical protein
MSITLAGTQEASVVVFKNLSIDSSIADIENLLRSIEITSTGIDRKVDSMGQFRGTAFVRFATPEIGHICIEKFEKQEPRIHGKRVKVELLRQGQRGRSYSAKDILDAGEELDTRLSRVRDIVTAFAYSDKAELNLPTDLDADQRKLAHSLAEKFGLAHATINPSGEALDASHSAAQSRSVHLSKNRAPSSRGGSMIFGSDDRTRSMASFVAAAATNELHKIQPLLPEVPVYAARPAHNLDQIAMMHAAQAQVHAAAAKAALEAAKRSKERDHMPDWLEVVEKTPSRPRAKSNLNPNAAEFIPSSVLAGEEAPQEPPGLI